MTTSPFLVLPSAKDCSAHSLPRELLLSHQSLGKWDPGLDISHLQTHFSLFLGEESSTQQMLVVRCPSLLPFRDKTASLLPLRVWPKLGFLVGWESGGGPLCSHHAPSSPPTALMLSAPGQFPALSYGFTTWSWHLWGCVKGTGRYTQDSGVGEMLEPESSVGRESALSLHSVGSNQHDTDIDIDRYITSLSSYSQQQRSKPLCPELLARRLESHKHHNV